VADGFRTRPQRYRLRASRASSAASTSSIRSRMSRSVRTDTCSSGSISSSGSNSSRLMRGDRSGRVRHVSRVELTSLGAVGDHVGGCSAFDKQRGGIGVTVAVAERVPVRAASAGGVDQRTWAPGLPPRGRRARDRWTAAAAQQPRPRLPVQVTKMSDAADRADNDPLAERLRGGWRGARPLRRLPGCASREPSVFAEASLLNNPSGTRRAAHMGCASSHAGRRRAPRE
jgi:hypothetical protein